MSLSKSVLSSARCLSRPKYAQQLRCSSSTSSESNSLGVTELSNILAEEHELSKAQSKRIVTSLFENIAESLKDKKKVSISNFGSFSTVRSEGRNGRNPSTGQPMYIPSKDRVKFTAFKALKESVNK